MRHVTDDNVVLQLKAAWELSFPSSLNGSSIIDVQQWRVPQSLPRLSYSSVPFFFQDELCLVRLALPFLLPPPSHATLFTISLDSIGNGGFSHDFGCLEGKTSRVMTAFDSFGSVKPSFNLTLSYLLGPILPALSSKIPNERRDKLKDLGRDIRGIATALLEKAAREKVAVGMKFEVNESIIGALGNDPFSFSSTSTTETDTTECSQV